VAGVAGSSVIFGENAFFIGIFDILECIPLFLDRTPPAGHSTFQPAFTLYVERTARLFERLTP
jgi:hypothetical protein